ncbi:MAG: sn-glycerol-3-phosphate import ATP-binding protein UgpC [Chroococcidiopsis sp. SAG 2025]|uniref:ABC transporter ATP-binding protein n=1 Tax=Chroococcidiopsis sp. SAG 2025 TaxID=171389 RepID=UPI002936D792|nr:ATP-binding cassette domain-containing protein [Chroococcidiopsis sp. SAG 2025]MDV2993332.1 sn-glycerol-3-phosphate import ATP-binding protein UgpC [Chroococcidiopsis sp. SAG 2025]
MAAVTLENVYKSFPARPGDRAVVPMTADLLAPVEVTPAMEASKSQVEKVPKQAENVDVLRSINLTIEDGEFMVLVGPSGCGKSTLLRSIAGLEELSSGNIWVGDRLVNQLPPKARDIAMVFQNYALYPHMSVYDNIAFGLRRTRAGGAEGVEGAGGTRIPLQIQNVLVGMTSRLPKGLRYMTARERAIDQRVRSVAALLQIESFLQRLPKQLSGGQKQRVALGRAIARNPQVFLMDEPLSNLDAKLRAETRAQIVKLQRQLGTTTIYVTHDQTEAMTMGDRIAVMHQGQIEQVARPLELYNHPATKFVAEFIGSPPMNFLSVQFQAPQAIVHPLFRLNLSEVWASTLQKYDGRDLILGIRPEHLNLSSAAPDNLPVQVELVEALGNETYLFVTTMTAANATPTPLQVRIPPERTVNIGEQLWLSLHPEKIHFFDPATNLSVSRKL